MKSESKGPRGFAVLIQQVDEGSLHAELSTAMQELAVRLNEHANRFHRDAKGEMTLTLGMSVDAKGVVALTGSVKTKLPKAPKVSSQFWLTTEGNLTLENPRQQKLALREVPAPVAASVADEAHPARSV